MQIKSAGSIQAVLKTKPLVAIDLVLQAFVERTRMEFHSSEDEAQLLALFAQAILSHLVPEKQMSDVTPIDAVLDPRMNQHNRRFVAAAMLHLLATDTKVLQQEKLSGKVASLFDDVFAADLYPVLKITPRNQTFEKERELRGYLVATQEQLRSAVMSIRSLSTLTTSREDIMRALKSKGARALIDPYIPGNLQALLNQVFVVGETYIQAKQSEQSRVIEAVRAIREAVRDLETVSQRGTGLADSWV